jgi:hypothetical protein
MWCVEGLGDAFGLDADAILIAQRLSGRGEAAGDELFPASAGEVDVVATTFTGERLLGSIDQTFSLGSAAECPDQAGTGFETRIPNHSRQVFAGGTGEYRDHENEFEMQPHGWPPVSDGNSPTNAS